MRELDYPFDRAAILKKRKSLRRRLLEEIDGGAPEVRIAILGGVTTDDIAAAAELFLLNFGIKPIFWQSEYNSFYEDAVFGNPQLDEFRPDLIYVCTSVANLRYSPDMSADREQSFAMLDAEFERCKSVWTALERFGCPIIQNNFDPPPYALLGNMDCCDHRGGGYAVNFLNMKFAEYAQITDGFYLLDLSRTAAEFGLDRWHDLSYWYMFKYPCAREALTDIAYKFALIVKSIYGKNRKLLAVDLDNTLWGGVVGDDGAEGLEIGQETGVSQAFYEFQRYILRLRQMGVVLTVCSKNERENALAGLSHPEGAVKPEDFALIKANWESKDRNLVETVSQLGLLTSAIVFADDNPAEREIVRQNIPDAAVADLTMPENYIREISRGGYFEPASITADDLSRSEMYRKNAQRAELLASVTSGAKSYGDYLASLEMTAEIAPFKPIYLDRITQLTNKSNQFNLTTLRLTRSETEKFMTDPQYVTQYGKLIDKFGDNGVVSVAVGKIDGETLEIILWLMSCRVLKRDMELAMLDGFVARAKAAGIRRLVGRYIPTAKNKMVERFYPDVLGFEPLESFEDGSTTWQLDISDYKNKNKYIKIS